MDHASQREKIQRMSCIFSDEKAQALLSKHSSVLGQDTASNGDARRKTQKDTERQRDHKCHLSWLQLSFPLHSLFCLYVCVSFSFFLPRGPWSTHTYTRCSPRHKGPHGNRAFRSPVALFMQRCITMGPPTGHLAKKARRSPMALLRSLFLSNHTICPPTPTPSYLSASSIPFLPPPPPPLAPLPPSLKARRDVWKRETGRGEQRKMDMERKYTHLSPKHRRVDTHTCSHTCSHTHIVLLQWNSMAWNRRDEV